MSLPETHRLAAEATERPLVLLHGGNVANWMREPRVAAFADRVLHAGPPGFGMRCACRRETPAACVTSGPLEPAGAGMRLYARLQLRYRRAMAAPVAGDDRRAVSRTRVRIVPGAHHDRHVADFSLFTEVLRACPAGSIDPRLHESVTGR